MKQWERARKRDRSCGQVIRLLVPKEAADYDDGKDQHDRVENLEIEAHGDVQTPADEHDERSVEEGGLNRCSQDVGKREVHLVVVGLVHGSDMLGRLLDNRYQDQAEEGVADAMLSDGRDLLHQNVRHERNEHERDHHCRDRFSKCKFVLGKVLVPIVVALLIRLQDVFVQAVMRATLKPDIHAKRDQQNDGGGVGDFQGALFYRIWPDITITESIDLKSCQRLSGPAHVHQALLTQAKQHVGQNGSEYRSPDDRDVSFCFDGGAVFLQQYHEENDLHDRPERGLEDDSGDLGKLAGQLLASEPHQVRGRDHTQVGTRKHRELMALSVVEEEDQGGDGEGPEEVGQAAGAAGAPPADAEEVNWMEQGAATLAVRLDALGHLVAVVIDAISVRIVPGLG
nr:hypothetical protein CFP56_11008 [Quercus suber]